MCYCVVGVCAGFRSASDRFPGTAEPREPGVPFCGQVVGYVSIRS